MEPENELIMEKEFLIEESLFSGSMSVFRGVLQVSFSYIYIYIYIIL